MTRDHKHMLVNLLSTAIQLAAAPDGNPIDYVLCAMGARWDVTEAEANLVADMTPRELVAWLKEP